jgi:hypothetical protein
VFDSPDVPPAGTRRILVCPYCHGLQAVPPQPVQVAIFAIGCRRCHRVFCITEARAAPASDRADEGIITPRRTPEPVSIGRRVEPAAGGSRQAPERPTGNRLMGMLRQLRSTAIALLAIASAAVAMHALLAVLDSVHAALRRAPPMGKMMTVGRAAGESVCQSGREAGEARCAIRRSADLRHQK